MIDTLRLCSSSLDAVFLPVFRSIVFVVLFNSTLSRLAITVLPTTTGDQRGDQKMCGK